MGYASCSRGNVAEFLWLKFFSIKKNVPRPHKDFIMENTMIPYVINHALSPYVHGHLQSDIITQWICSLFWWISEQVCAARSNGCGA